KSVRLSLALWPTPSSSLEPHPMCVMRVLCSEYYIHSQSISITPPTISEIDRTIEILIEAYPNIEYLNRRSAVLGDVRLIGATLWSDVPEDARSDVGSRMNDYNMIYITAKPEDTKKYPKSKFDNLLPPNIRRLNVDD